VKRFIIVFTLIFITLTLAFSQKAGEKPYVLIVSFDGFRWDYLNRGITPNLQKLAERGVRAITFEPVFPSKTFPNHYTIVTGLYAENHGLINNRFFDPYKKRLYRLADPNAVLDAYWYKGEALWETAGRQGVLSASYFWPGSEVTLEYRHPNFFKKYDGSTPGLTRINGIIKWLELPEEKRPHLLFLYFSDTDDYGHRYGPESEQINEAIQLLDTRVGQLQTKLDSIGFADKINLIVLSDHGMTSLRPNGQILLYKILKDFKARMDGYGPLVQFSPKNEAEKQQLYQQLILHQNHYTVYTKENIPEYLHYRNSPFIGEIIALADLGYTFVRTPQELEKIKKNQPKGDHGYDNHTLDMQGLFVASGPAFKQGYQCETLHNVDVYPLVCKILGLVPNAKIDGRLERIDFVLK